MPSSSASSSGSLSQDMSLSDPVFHFQLTSCFCSTLAIVTTLYRLFVRRSKLWIDDGCAFFAMSALCVQMGAVFTPPTPPNGVTRYYLMITTFYVIVWFSRLSILFSIIRIDPNKLRKKLLFASGVIFVIACAFLVAQLFWTCHFQKEWQEMSVPQCTLTRQVAITQLAFNTLADILILVVPIQLLIVLQDHWLRSRLMIIFSTCTLTTIVSLVHAIFILTMNGPAIVIVALVESSVSLVVCSVPVVTTAVLQLGSNTPRVSSTNLLGSNNSNLNPPMSVHFLPSSHAPTPFSTICTAEPVTFLGPDSAASRMRTVPARPSSVLLKPEEPLTPPFLHKRLHSLRSSI